MTVCSSWCYQFLTGKGRVGDELSWSYTLESFYARAEALTHYLAYKEILKQWVFLDYSLSSLCCLVGSEYLLTESLPLTFCFLASEQSTT